ncbi:MAG TPA: hypothetical protein VKS79_19165 [Gemmataceae bacterium]|nr:hypothetical protein [Gemmataceae bacterium]
MTELPPPTFSLGQWVNVIVNERNRTPQTGSIREIVWHYKFSKYFYLLEVDKKKVAKRYFQEDLEPMQARL